MTLALPEDRYINAGGIRTRYWTAGTEGPPLILVHGLGASAEIWHLNVVPLSACHRVYVPDLPGFGHSEKSHHPVSPVVFTRFLGDFMTALGIERANLIGQSLGGGISLFFALRHPERVERLVLADSAGLGREVTFTLRLLSLPLIGEIIFRPSHWGVSLFFKMAVKNPAVITDDLVAVYQEFFTREGARKYLLHVARSIMDIHGARREIVTPIVRNLHRIASPTLVIWGRRDRVLPLSHAVFATGRIPHSTLDIFDSCGHIPNLEMPDRFNNTVCRFLSKRS